MPWFLIIDQNVFLQAKKAFGWEPKVPFDELVKDMMTSDIELMKSRPNA